MYSSEVKARLEELTPKAIDGTATIEECKEIVELVRAGRVSAARTSASSKARKAPVDVAGLEDELDGVE